MSQSKKKKQNFHHKKIKVSENQTALGLWVVFFVFILVLSIFLISKYFFRAPSQNLSDSLSPSPTEEASGCPFKSFLNGECVKEKTLQEESVVGVMVENHNDAQPLAGVSQASIIYEAPVEGNIPRWLVLFPLGSDVQKVGPVRSARPYYLDWISEYGDAMYLHVGGSAEALEKIKQFDIFDINEFYFGNVAFWRATNRFAPHNTYTSGQMWRATFEKEHVGRKDGAYTPWNFKEVTPCDTPSSTACTTSISFSFVGGSYDIQWKYNSLDHHYERWQNGRQQKDEQGNALVADTVILERVEMEVLDEVGRRKITTIGEGDVVVYTQGKKEIGKWKKVSRQSRTAFVKAGGEDLALSAGKIWVEVVPEEISVVEK